MSLGPGCLDVLQCSVQRHALHQMSIYVVLFLAPGSKNVQSLLSGVSGRLSPCGPPDAAFCHQIVVLVQCVDIKGCIAIQPCR